MGIETLFVSFAMFGTQPFDDQEKALLAALTQKSLWTEKAWPEIETHLQAAKATRSSRVASVLAKHITYTRFGMRDKPYPLETRFPVYATLKGIGMPSVPGLLSQLRAINPKESSNEQSLILYCLADIYEEGGKGRQIARHRIEIEVNTDAKNAGYLKHALENAWLKGLEK
jgi:hypothetical protein